MQTIGVDDRKLLFKPPLTKGEIAESFAGDAFFPVQPEQEVELLEDGGFIEVLLIEPVEPGPFMIAAKIEVIVPGAVPTKPISAA